MIDVVHLSHASLIENTCLHLLPEPGFSKIFKSGPKVSKSVLKWSKSIFQVFLTVTHLLDHFWNPLDTFGKNGLRVMSASSLVLSSLLSLLSTVHLPTRES